MQEAYKPVRACKLLRLLQFRIYGRQWKFTHILVYLKPGTMFAPMQDAHENEAKGMESLEM